MMWKFTKKNHENNLKTTMFIWAIIIFALWICWFTLDLYFINKGMWIDETWEITWDVKWHDIVRYVGFSVYALIGAYFFMEVFYIVFKARGIKTNKGVSIYEMVLHIASAIVILVTMSWTIQMLVDSKWVIDVAKMALTNDGLYHLQFMNVACTAFTMVVFSFVNLTLSNRKHFNISRIMQDANIMFIVFAVMCVILFPFQVLNAWPQGPKGVEDFDHFFTYLCGAIIKIPGGTFTGTIIVIAFARAIAAGLLPKEKINKPHLIVFIALVILSIIAFLLEHATPVDVGKMLTCETFEFTVCCFAATIGLNLALLSYGSISIYNYQKLNAKNKKSVWREPIKLD